MDGHSPACDVQGQHPLSLLVWAGSLRNHLSIDREDNDRGYSPENCRWETEQQQARNTRRNRLLTAFGETKTMVEWEEDARCAVNANAFRRRILLGWNPEEALFTPLRTSQASAAAR